MGVLDDTAAPHPSLASSTSIDGTNQKHVQLLLEDLKEQYQNQVELLKTERDKGQQEQHAAFSGHMIQLTKNIKGMKVADFNRKYHCNLIHLIQTKAASSSVSSEVAGKKRLRPAAAALETPAPTGRHPRGVPGTAVRTVQRGEEIFSKNGTPVDTAEEGTLVATVSKKRRAGNKSIIFDINVGDGRYLNLADPGTVQHLDANMKTEAKSQLLAMQEQMAVLMAQLET